MKPIEETHPSLLKELHTFAVVADVFPTSELLKELHTLAVVADVFPKSEFVNIIQKNTIDKAVLKETIDKVERIQKSGKEGGDWVKIIQTAGKLGINPDELTFTNVSRILIHILKEELGLEEEE